MARFNLNKGDRFKLSKDAGLNNLQVHLSWDGDHTKAQAYLKDLLELHECQQQAGIDTTETDTLVEAYKKIINAR